MGKTAKRLLSILLTSCVILCLFASPIQSVASASKLMVAGGYSRSLALLSDGTVWEWGLPHVIELVEPGDNSINLRNKPVKVSGLDDVCDIATGLNDSLALKSDGTVWAWGRSYYAQLGDDTTTKNVSPVHVMGLSDVVSIAAGDGFYLALKNDGTVWAWGGNGYGQLGDSTGIDSSTPVRVLGIADVSAIAARGASALALKQDGTVWAWGLEREIVVDVVGEWKSRSIPVKVSSLTNVSAIAEGNCFSLALKNDGTVWAWGWNDVGQLGDGTRINRSTPLQVSGLTGVCAISAGDSHSLALKNDGTVWAWGWNYFGKLGGGTDAYSTKPVQVSDLSGVIAIATGVHHSLAIKNDGTVWAWGGNSVGELGDGTITTRVNPVQVARFNSFNTIHSATLYGWQMFVLGLVVGVGLVVKIVRYSRDPKNYVT